MERQRPRAHSATAQSLTATPESTGRALKIRVGALVRAARWRFRQSGDVLAEGAVGEVVWIKDEANTRHPNVQVVAVDDRDGEKVTESAIAFPVTAQVNR